ncbi:uncharacterized protein IUM83_14817 [Phytophthora cinnamomi]|uniref:uncharacterized protein n=1 Tax=Phytophthora cinnamomi TaxID=4785 RepID=UPI00355944B1|nr:hypothetical protein IUM83_14817 [Phytophthora cinnamomi]
MLDQYERDQRYPEFWIDLVVLTQGGGDILLLGSGDDEEVDNEKRDTARTSSKNEHAKPAQMKRPETEVQEREQDEDVQDDTRKRRHPPKLGSPSSLERLVDNQDPPASSGKRKERSSSDYANEILRGGKKARSSGAASATYHDLAKVVPPTSNTVERLFSQYDVYLRTSNMRQQYTDIGPVIIIVVLRIAVITTLGMHLQYNRILYCRTPVWGCLWVGSCLPTPVMFIESDAVTDSESEVYIPDGYIPSDSDPEVAEESESDEEAAPDFSVEPGECCADENQEAVV